MSGKEKKENIFKVAINDFFKAIIIIIITIIFVASIKPLYNYFFSSIWTVDSNQIDIDVWKIINNKNVTIEKTKVDLKWLGNDNIVIFISNIIAQNSENISWNKYESLIIIYDKKDKNSLENFLFPWDVYSKASEFKISKIAISNDDNWYKLSDIKLIKNPNKENASLFLFKLIDSNPYYPLKYYYWILSYDNKNLTYRLSPMFTDYSWWVKFKKNFITKKNNMPNFFTYSWCEEECEYSWCQIDCHNEKWNYEFEEINKINNFNFNYESLDKSITSIVTNTVELSEIYWFDKINILQSNKIEYFQSLSSADWNWLNEKLNFNYLIRTFIYSENDWTFINNNPDYYKILNVNDPIYKETINWINNSR